MRLSVVVPMYNEEAGASTFNRSLINELSTVVGGSYELIYVNDGSSDNTLKLLTSFANKNNKIKVVNLSRNFGKEIATTAGISLSTGKATLIMDGDGQHPPKLIKEFVEKWKNGAQVVIGVRNSNQKEGIIKKLGSRFFYHIFNATSGAKIVPRSTDFRLIDEVVRNEFLHFKERNRITRGLIDWLGFRRDFIYFDAPPRLAGEASYKTSQLIRLAMNSFVSLSLTPLYLAGYAGLVLVPLSLLGGIFILIEQFLMGDPLGLSISGAAMLTLLVIFLVGILLISQGLIAIYLSHVHTQTQDRPLFVIDYSSSVGIGCK